MWNAMIAGTPLRRWAAYGALLGGGFLFPVRVGVVTGESMEPSLRDGQAYCFAPRLYSGERISRGDVVVFEHEGGTYVKRVLAVPGESVYVLRYEDSGDEVISAWRLERMLRRPFHGTDYVKIAKVTVPADRMYVIGDHLGSSLDSRQFGTIPTSQIIGRVLFAPPARPDFTALATEASPHRS